MTAATRDRLLAIDIGTTGTKVGLFSADGCLLHRAYRSYPLHSPRPGWAEQSADDWWRAVVAGLAEMPRAALDGVAGITVVGQNPTLVSTDAHGHVLRPAIGWADRRADAEARELSARVGRAVDPSFNLPKAMWLSRHQADGYAQTATLFQGFDFINFRLTGERCATSALPPWPPWDAAQIAASGLDRLPVPARHCTIGEPIGAVNASAARETGLAAGTMVYAGLADGIAAWIGTGTIAPGELFTGSGTSAGANVCWPAPLSHAEQRVASLPHPLGGNRWMIGGPMSTGGRLLDWLARDVCGTDVGSLIAEAEAVPAGAGGLLALPYLLGERAPLFDPHARAVFFGLSSEHTRAHLAKAGMEAVAFAVRDVAETAEGIGARIDCVRTGGGGARSAQWNQIKADILGKPVIVPQVIDSSLLGAAIVAAAGARLHADGDAATRAMVRTGATFEPRAMPVYDDLFALFRSLYTHVRGDLSTLAAIRERTR